ncbi:MAG: hypothetical protein PHV17_02860 [Candidatus Omnitrophica bacterium]|nr:hypothetical protein [Candidatus Omnitrophota bacterium]
MLRFKEAFFIFALILLPFSLFAFNFEDYEWGKNQEQVLSGIKNKNKQIIKTDNPRVLKYFDKILDEDCTIMLEFTPKTKLLSSIKIVWSEKSVGKDLKKLLSDKYGQYRQPNAFI